ncbi:MAG: hypothetical protein LBC97_02260 [Bifidobacteriaceae bacterium]|nr:hypothetical protein [Bifidobacteriaceae bacterium]
MDAVPALCWGGALATVTYGVPAVLAPILPTVGLVISCLVTVVASALMARRAFDAYLYYWLVLAMSQNFISGLWFRLVQEEAPLAVTEAKTLSALVAAAACAPAVWNYLSRLRPVLWVLAAYFACMAINLRSLAPSALAYGRNFALPILVLLLVAARTRTWQRERKNQILGSWLSFLASALFAGAMIEEMVGTSRWRGFMGTETLASLSSLSTSTPLFGIKIERIGGFLGEPVTAGYIASGTVLAAAMLWFSASSSPEERSRLGALGVVRFCLVIMGAGIACFLSGVKMAPLLLVLGFALYGLGQRPAWRAKVVAAAPAMVALATLTYMTVLYRGAVVHAFSDPASLIRGDSSSIHWSGLVLGVRSALSQPLGHHLGEGGNFGRLFDVLNEDSSAPASVIGTLETGSESGLGVMAYQIGLPGLILFVVVVALLARMLGRQSAALLGTWIGTAAIAESMLGPLVAGPLLISAALLAEPEHSPAPPRRRASKLGGKSDKAASRMTVRRSVRPKQG